MPPAGWSLAKTLRVHDDAVEGVVWSPDGKLFASCGLDGRLVVADADALKATRVIRPNSPVFAAAFSPDGRRIACSLADVAHSEQLATLIEDLPAPIPDELDDELGLYEVSNEWVAEPDLGDGLSLPIRIFDSSSGELLASFVSPTARRPPSAVLWSRDGRIIATCNSSDGLLLWQARTGAILRTSEELRCTAMATSPDGRSMCVAGAGLWAVAAASSDGPDEVVYSSEAYTAVAWSARGVIALGVDDGSVEIVDRDRPERMLEAHSGAISSLTFSQDGDLLATKSLDGNVFLWDTKDWTLISRLSEPARGQSRRAGTAFSPVADRLLSLGRAGKAVRVWDLDRLTLAARRHVAPTVHYANTKVVLLGDQGVGKTGLGLVLAGEPWQATESTHRRHVWRIESFEHEALQPERRETYLWDLAGQPGYRLLHQLHLGDVAVAVVVFDARNEVDPFAGVRHWVRALRLAERDRGAPVPRLLVSARNDRGGPAASPERISEAVAEYGFDAYLETSGKEGWGVAELFESISTRIDWASVPKVSSTGLFDSIRQFLTAERDRGRMLMTIGDLASDYRDTQEDGELGDRLLDEFETCVGRVAARGLIRRLSFGGMVLLKPEVLDAYAASLVNAVRNQPDGTGEISEDAARKGDFRMPADERIEDAQLERLLLTATVEEVLSHEVALRENSDDGPYLVFPTQSRREVNPLEAPDQFFATIIFEGPVAHIYATLVVRLAHSGFFTREETYRDATVFKRGGASVGVVVAEKDEAAGEFRLFAEGNAASEIRRLFLDYVRRHAERRALPNSVLVDLNVRCGSCGLEVTREQRTLASERGRTTLRCMICDASIDIAGIDLEDDSNDLVIRKMDQTADAERELSAARASLSGKEQVGDFDVFLAHNSSDKPAVRRLASNLRGFGIHPWVDEEQIPPGRWFQDIIQRAISQIPVAAIIIGPSGLGRWEIVELRSFISQCVDRGIPIIPVLLPGGAIPPDLIFLSEFGWVRFEKAVDEAEALKRLRWGITDPTDARGQPL